MYTYGTSEFNQMMRNKGKSLPKKVKELNTDYGYFVCNTCDSTVGYSEDYREHHYCLNCGQELSWE